MFLRFMYLLRSRGLPVTLEEWLVLTEGLKRGLHGSTLSGFYFLCRAVLVKSEADFDKFDSAFDDYFLHNASTPEIPQRLLDWLNRPKGGRAKFDPKDLDELSLSMDRVEEMFRERLREQTEEHNGGSYWVGTRGTSAFGNGGKILGGIRVGGESHYHMAYRTLSERSYQDWRKDTTIESRQFQMAFRTLRQFSSLDQRATEFDVDGTIRKTCDNGGMLRITYKKPRNNAIKLMLLIDFGGSMEPYSELCRQLFQSVQKASHFKDLKIYYFHNCVTHCVYSEPNMDYRMAVKTDWILQNLSQDYRVVILGDAEMDPEDLLGDGSAFSRRNKTGMDWLLSLKQRYPHIIWLHPQPHPVRDGSWTITYRRIEKEFDMYQLTVDGLQAGMKKLMVSH